MFYKQFSTIIDILNPEFVENFDYWLATLPRRNQKNITEVVSIFVSSISSSALTFIKYAGLSSLKISSLSPLIEMNFSTNIPRRNQKNITASVVSARLEVKYSLAESILKFAEKQKILEKYYLP